MNILHGDCLEVLPTLDADSIDACVTDPPYGLTFMGKDWDHGVPGEHFWREVMRVLKPGAHLLAFGGTRTFHRLACAIEDAGFEIRDCLSWLYGSGFPKSLDVSKAMDNVIGKQSHGFTTAGGKENYQPQDKSFRSDYGYKYHPATDLARQWSGWGTALKPAWEPIILARKPLIGTVAANVERYGTGAVNVDGCRIGTTKDVPASVSNRVESNCYGEWTAGERQNLGGHNPNIGRWPANLVLDEEAAAMLDEQAGTNTGAHGNKGQFRQHAWMNGPSEQDIPRDSGGASRFFYVAKASRSERNAGLDGMEERYAPRGNGFSDKLSDTKAPRANHHPTVKPIALMRWLCRLVTPPGGIVLDPFTGSGTTGCAAVLEGFDFLGIEQDAEYVEIARRRVEHWAEEARNAPPEQQALPLGLGDGLQT